MEAPQINIVTPLYNEEDVFEALVERLNKVMDEADASIEVIMVDDGSKDKTADLMRSLSLKDPRYQAVFLSRNFGHQRALSAGLSFVNATEGALIIDGDLQDPPELLTEFYPYLKEGYDVVYAVRKSRKESLPKKMAYKLFYALLNRISYINIPLDAGDFSLISRRVVDHLNSLPEESRFLRGMRSWIGYKQIGLPYKRDARSSGQSKYSLNKLIGLAFNGLFNFSEFPIKFITNLGSITMAISGLYFIYTLIQRFVYGNTPQGFTAILFTIILFGGVQLFALGLIGEYVLRIFFQVKGRPIFIVKERIHQSKIKRGKELL